MTVQELLNKLLEVVNYMPTGEVKILWDDGEPITGIEIEVETDTLWLKVENS